MASAVHRSDLVAFAFKEARRLRKLGSEEIEIRKAREEFAIFYANERSHRRHHNPQCKILEVVCTVRSDDALVIAEVDHDGENKFKQFLLLFNKVTVEKSNQPKSRPVLK